MSGRTYSNLDDICSNQVEILESSQNGPQLSSRPPTSLRGTSCGCKCRIKSINVNRQINRLRGTNTVDDLLDDAPRANGVDLAGLDNLEATVAIIVVVTGATKGGSDTSVDVGVVGEQAFLVGMVEVGAMVDGGNLGWRATKHLWLPCKDERVSMRWKICTSIEGLQVSRWLSKWITETGP